MHKRILLYWVIFLIPLGIMGQKPGFSPDGVQPKTSFFRKVLSKFSVNAQFGYGRTLYNHDIPDFAIFANNGELLLTDDVNSGVDNPITAYRYWMNDPQLINTTFYEEDKIQSSDSSSYRMTAKGTNIPINLSIHLVLFEKFRIGGGTNFEFHSIDKVNPKGAGESFGVYQSNYKFALFRRNFGYIGYRFLKLREWTYVAEFKMGGFKLGKHYENALVDKSLFYDIGVLLENNLSEYFRLTVKPSLEFKNYTLAMPNSTALKHRMVTPYINVGMSYSLPDLRRCVIKTCHVQINHVHGNREYRSRRHPFYKKQNPNYGQNYRKLNPDRGKNKQH